MIFFEFDFYNNFRKNEQTVLTLLLDSE